VDFSNIIYCFALKKLLIDTTIRSILIESSVQISGHKQKKKDKMKNKRQIILGNAKEKLTEVKINK
jgi:hypothetical protein